MLKFFKKKLSGLKRALSKSKDSLIERLTNIFKGRVDEDMLEEIEAALYESDLGSQLVQEFSSCIKSTLRERQNISTKEVMNVLKNQALKSFSEHATLPIHEDKQVLFLIGTNGNGKTTTAAKLAHYYKERGKSVLLVAADTFRAAAVSQLATWAKRLDCDCVKGAQGSDPAAVVYDGLSKYKAKGYDICICDTAGRLDSKTHLMKELQKIQSMAEKLSIPYQKNYMVLDATIGQNALDQAKTFQEHIPLHALILTKLDGSAKGGAALSILKNQGLPIAFVGTGESVQDLSPFSIKEFIDSLFSYN